MFNSAENNTQDGESSGDILTDPAGSAGGVPSQINKMPLPDPWPDDKVGMDQRIPQPIPHPLVRLNEINVRNLLFIVLIKLSLLYVISILTAF